MKVSSHYQEIGFNQEKSLLEIVWKNTEQMEEVVYKKEVLWQLDQILKFSPRNLLINTQSFVYTIVPRVQEWANQTILPKVLATGVLKIAIIVPADLFAQISIEQQMEDNPDALNLVRYFENENSAKQWL